MVIVGNYTPTGLDYANLTKLEELRMYDGVTTSDLRESIQNLAKDQKKLRYLETKYWGSTSIDDSAFDGASCLKEISGFEDVETLGAYSFRSTALTSIFLAQLETITGSRTFQYCAALKSVHFPKLTTINSAYCFRDDSQLSDVLLPTLTTITAVGCFSVCNKLISISLPSLTSSVPGNTFENSVNLEFVSFLNANVETLFYNLFLSCTKLNSIELQNENVKTVDSQAFSGCSKLATASFPNATDLKTRGFSGCTNLTQVTLPNLTSITGERAFENCKGLTEVSFPSLLSISSNYTFLYCNKIASISFPRFTGTLPYGTFEGCSALIHISIPEALVENLSPYLFNGCSSLASTMLQSMEWQSEIVRTISEGAFFGCAKLAAASFPSVTSIGNSGFINCSGLRSITLSDQISSVGTSAFKNVTNCAINFVGHASGGTLHNGVVLSCERIQSGGFGTVSAFGFSLGADIGQNEGTLVAYINEILTLTRTIPLLTNVAIGASILDLGTSLIDTTELTQHGGLIDVIKIGATSYTWNGSAWA
jgi:hypothetical protein